MRGPYGEAVRRAREARGLTQQELADRANTHRDTVVRAEQSGNVGVLILYQLAEALTVDITTFFDGGIPGDESAQLGELTPLYARLSDEQRAQLLRLARSYLGL